MHDDEVYSRGSRTRGVTYRILLEITLVMVFVLALHYAAGGASQQAPSEVQSKDRSTAQSSGVLLPTLSVALGPQGRLRVDGQVVALEQLPAMAAERRAAIIALLPNGKASWEQVYAVWRYLQERDYRVQFGI